MPLYYFNLKDSRDIYLDPDGTELPDSTHAFEHARAVALELMQRREIKTRAWQLQVCDVYQNVLCQLLFASLDPSMNAFPPPLRNSAEKVYGETAELNDALRNVRKSVVQLKDMLRVLPV